MIKWITGEIATAPYNKAVASGTDASIIDVRDLVDKAGNRAGEISKKIDEALDALKHGKKIIICCDYGMSRSNSVATGVLSRWQQISFNNALKKVLEATGETQIKLEVLSVVRHAVESKRANKKQPKKYLITGSTGYIGSNLKRDLQNKYPVVSPPREQIDLLTDTLNLDILIKEENVNCIIHLAHPRILNTTNSLGEALVMLRNVLDIAVENRCWLIYVSSADIYGAYDKDHLKAKETLKPFPKGINGETKWLCEELIRHYTKKYQLKTTIIRSSAVYGPGSIKPHFITNFIKKAKSNDEITTHKYANGFPTVDLLHIDDLVACIGKVIKKKYYGDLNVGSDTALRTHDIAGMIVQELQSSSHVNVNNIAGKNCNFVMNVGKALQEISWKPVRLFGKEFKQIVNG